MAFENHETTLAEDFPALARYLTEAEARRENDETRDTNGRLMLPDRIDELVRELFDNGVASPAVLRTRTADGKRFVGFQAKLQEWEDCLKGEHVLKLERPDSFDLESALAGFAARVRRLLYDPHTEGSTPMSSEIPDLPDNDAVLNDIGRLIASISQRAGTSGSLLFLGKRKCFIFNSDGAIDFSEDLPADDEEDDEEDDEAFGASGTAESASAQSA